MADLHLTEEQEALVAGESGLAVQRAMEIVVGLGKVYGAACLVPVSSVQVAGVSYKNLGEAGLSFLLEWAEQGAKVRVPTTLNPAGMDIENWRALGFPESFARNQTAVVEAYSRMGIALTCTCTPYWVGNCPAPGEHIAWAESSAVSFANSLLGARTNREGGPSALAAAISGHTAAYGLHRTENRIACARVDVACSLNTVSDWSALGYLIGREVRDGVPYLAMDAAEGAFPDPDHLLEDPATDGLKSLGAAMAASGAVGLYHIEGVTPEARRTAVLGADARRIVIRDLAPAYAALNSQVSEIDLVSIGCPHASPHEIREIARAVAGKRLSSALWVTTARETLERTRPDVSVIEAAGGRVVADTCMVVAPVKALGFRSLATNSAKMALYTPSHSGLSVRFGPLEQCIQAALSGTW
jgi:predicted aconitase